MTIERYNHFCRLAMLDNDQLKERRRSGKIYGQFVICSPHADKWFAAMEGIEFVAEITFMKNEHGKRMIKEVTPVRFSGSREVVRGLPVPASAVLMI